MSEYIVVKENELSHHGIVGMHWGKRNGPPYPLNSSTHKAVVKGKSPTKKKPVRPKVEKKKTPRGALGGANTANNGEEQKSKFQEYFEPTIKNGKDKPKQSKAQIVTREAEKTVNNVRDAVNSTKNLTSNKKHSTSHMSDQELRERINRMNMEKQYNQLMNDKSTRSKGYERTMEVLTIVGKTAAIAASAATIATQIKKWT